MKARFLVFVTALASASALAQHQHHHHQAPGASPYAGQQAREIKALSADEVRDLQNGAGMGFAKTAELNRYPGPLHVLENTKGLGLSEAQQLQVSGVLTRHKERARALGERVVTLERELDELFAKRKATPGEVDRMTAALGEANGKLRAEHLKAHLETTALLTPEQVDKYVKARGY